MSSYQAPLSSAGGPSNSGKPTAGHIKFSLHAARNLYNTQCCSRMDPYVRLTLAKSQENSPTCVSGGVAPSWPSAPIFFLEVGGLKGANYDHLKVQVRNKNWFCDDDVGEINIPIEKLIADANSPEAQTWIWLGRKDNENTKAGELCATIKYVAPMTITLHEARNLYDVQLIGKQDPYVLLEMRGCLAKGDNGLRKSRTHDDGDKNPKWQESFQFNVWDDRVLMDELKKFHGAQSAKEEKNQEPGLWLQVVDENVIVDKSIGYCFVSLLQLVEARKAAAPQWFQLFKGKKEALGKEDCGKICVSVQ